MKRNLILLLLPLFLVVKLNAQDFKFRASLDYLVDYDWNKPQSETFATNKKVSLKSRTPVRVGFGAQMDFGTISPSLDLNLIYRRINYQERHVSVSDFNHYSLNIPLNVNLSLPVTDESSFIANLGGGINYVLTPSDKMKSELYTNGVLVEYFKILNPGTISPFVNLGIGWQLSFENVGDFQLKLQYNYELLGHVQYETEMGSFIYNSKKYNLNYFTCGLTYLFPLRKVK
ncbi:MAG: hypothetical protein ACOXZK_05170 [Bacteroidales bacterium]